MAADGKNPDPAKPGRGGAEIPFSPVVQRLLSGADEPQGLVTLVGYIGPSKKEGHVRLYTGLDFQTYYEVPRDRVALAEPVDREDENGPSRVLIGADATVELVQTSRQSGPASYLAGAIAGTFLAGAAAGQGAAAIPFPTRVSLCFCPSLVLSLCVCTRLPQCWPPITVYPQCPFPSGFVCGGIPGDPGGPVEAQAQVQAQAQEAVFPRPSILCPSYAIPCPSQWYHCPTRPPCPLPQAEAEQVAAPQAAAMVNWPTIYCSYFGGCQTRNAPCNTPRCPMAQMAQPQVPRSVLYCFTVQPDCTVYCTEDARCTLRHMCPTSPRYLC